MQSESGLGIGVERLRSNGKRVYALAHKRSVVEQCLMPGASVAGVALAHGINANLVRRWIVQHRSGRLFRVPAMLPVTLSAPTALLSPTGAKHPAAAGVIEIELEAARIVVRGVVDGAALKAVLEALAPR